LASDPRHEPILRCKPCRSACVGMLSYTFCWIRSWQKITLFIRGEEIEVKKKDGTIEQEVFGDGNKNNR